LHHDPTQQLVLLVHVVALPAAVHALHCWFVVAVPAVLTNCPALQVV